MKASYVALLLGIVGVAFSQNDVNPDPCLGKNGLVSNPSSCQSFFICSNETLEETVNCSDGLLFNRLLLTCDYSSSVDCSAETPAARSPPTKVQFSAENVECETDTCTCVYPSSLSCSDYYRCQNGVPIKESCPAGLYMNPQKLTCDYAENVECGIDSGAISSTLKSTEESNSASTSAFSDLATELYTTDQINHETENHDQSYDTLENITGTSTSTTVEIESTISTQLNPHNSTAANQASNPMPQTTTKDYILETQSTSQSVPMTDASNLDTSTTSDAKTTTELTNKFEDTESDILNLEPDFTTILSPSTKKQPTEVTTDTVPPENLKTSTSPLLYTSQQSGTTRLDLTTLLSTNAPEFEENISVTDITPDESEAVEESFTTSTESEVTTIMLVDETSTANTDEPSITTDFRTTEYGRNDTPTEATSNDNSVTVPVNTNNTIHSTVDDPTMYVTTYENIFTTFNPILSETVHFNTETEIHSTVTRNTDDSDSNSETTSGNPTIDLQTPINEQLITTNTTSRNETTTSYPDKDEGRTIESTTKTSISSDSTINETTFQYSTKPSETTDSDLVASTTVKRETTSTINSSVDNYPNIDTTTLANQKSTTTLSNKVTTSRNDTNNETTATTTTSILTTTLKAIADYLTSTIASTETTFKYPIETEIADDTEEPTSTTVKRETTSSSMTEVNSKTDASANLNQNSTISANGTVASLTDTTVYDNPTSAFESETTTPNMSSMEDLENTTSESTSVKETSMAESTSTSIEAITTSANPLDAIESTTVDFGITTDTLENITETSSDTTVSIDLTTTFRISNSTISNDGTTDNKSTVDNERTSSTSDSIMTSNTILADSEITNGNKATRSSSEITTGSFTTRSDFTKESYSTPSETEITSLSNTNPSDNESSMPDKTATEFSSTITKSTTPSSIDLSTFSETTHLDSEDTTASETTNSFSETTINSKTTPSDRITTGSLITPANTGSNIDSKTTLPNSELTSSSKTTPSEGEIITEENTMSSVSENEGENQTMSSDKIATVSEIISPDSETTKITKSYSSETESIMARKTTVSTNEFTTQSETTPWNSETTTARKTATSDREISMNSETTTVDQATTTSQITSLETETTLWHDKSTQSSEPITLDSESTMESKTTFSESELTTLIKNTPLDMETTLTDDKITAISETATSDLASTIETKTTLSQSEVTTPSNTTLSDSETTTSNITTPSNSEISQTTSTDEMTSEIMSLDTESTMITNSYSSETESIVPRKTTRSANEFTTVSETSPSNSEATTSIKTTTSDSEISINSETTTVDQTTKTSQITSLETETMLNDKFTTISEPATSDNEIAMESKTTLSDSVSNTSPFDRESSTFNMTTPLDSEITMDSETTPIQNTTTASQITSLDIETTLSDDTFIHESTVESKTTLSQSEVTTPSNTALLESETTTSSTITSSDIEITSNTKTTSSYEITTDTHITFPDTESTMPTKTTSLENEKANEFTSTEGITSSNTESTMDRKTTLSYSDFTFASDTTTLDNDITNAETVPNNGTSTTGNYFETTLGEQVSTLKDVTSYTSEKAPSLPTTYIPKTEATSMLSNFTLWISTTTDKDEELTNTFASNEQNGSFSELDIQSTTYIPITQDYDMISTHEDVSRSTRIPRKEDNSADSISTKTETMPTITNTLSEKLPTTTEVSKDNNSSNMFNYSTTTALPMTTEVKDPLTIRESTEMEYTSTTLIDSTEDALTTFKIPMTEEANTTFEMPITEDVFTTFEIPTTEYAMMTSEMPNIEDTMMTSEIPIAEHTLMVSEIPIAEEASITSEIPITEEASITSKIPITEEASVTSEIPITADALATFEIPLTEDAFMTSEIPISENALSTSDIPITEDTLTTTLYPISIMVSELPTNSTIMTISYDPSTEHDEFITTPESDVDYTLPNFDFTTDSSNLDCTCEYCIMADDDDCTKYFECLDGQYSSKPCKLGYLFNDDLKHCAKADNVYCEQNLTFCPTDGIFADSEDCSSFSHCYEGILYEKSCPTGLVYNAMKRTCDSDPSACGKTATLPSSRSMDVDCDCDHCLMPDSEDCSKYYICLDGLAYQEQCSQGLLFNPEISTCDYSSSVVACAQPSPMCLENNGNFSAPGDCQKFYHCAAGVAYEKTCGSGLHFSEVNQRCEDPCEAKCDSQLSCPMPSSGADVCEKSNGFYPNPENCHTFFQCLKGKATLSECVGDEHFNPVDLLCQDPCIAKCDMTLDCLTTTGSSTESAMYSDASIDQMLTTLNYSTIAAEDTTPSTFLTDVTESTYTTSTSVDDFSTSDDMPQTVTSVISYPTYDEYVTSTLSPTVDITNETSELYTDVTEDGAVTLVTTVVPDSTLPECDENGITYLKLGQCKSFYLCYGGIPFELQCPGDMHFNSLSRHCEPPCQAQCDLTLDCESSEEVESSTTLPLTLCKTRDILPKSKFCEYYIDCTSGIHNKKKCPSNLHFNPTKRVCDLPDLAECGSPAKTLPHPDPNYACPCETCMQPSENSCSEYVLCLNRTAYRMRCSEGLSFDRKRNTCNLVSKVSCDIVASTTTTTRKPIASTISTRKPVTTRHPSLTTTTYKPTTTTYRPTTSKSTTTTYRPTTNKSTTTTYRPTTTTYRPTTTTYRPTTTTYRPTTTTNRPTTTTYRPTTTTYRPTTTTYRPTTTTYRPTTSKSATTTTIPRVPQTSTSKKPTSTTTSKPTSQPHSVRCPKPDGMFRNPNHCGSFIHCSNWHPFITQCAPGTHFSVEHQRCEWPYIAKCESSTPKPTSHPHSVRCPKPDGMFRNPDHCGSFIHCSNWHPFIKQCAPGTHFSVEHQRCEWPYIAKCETSMPSKSTTQKPTPDPICQCRNCLLPSEKSCTMYYECRDGKSSVKECPKGQTFDRNISTCDWAHRVVCDHSEICPKRYGVFPHKSDCRKFVRCENGIPHIHTCPYVLEFDPDVSRCTYPNGKCRTSESSEIYDKEPTTRPPAESWQCPHAFGYFRHLERCNLYYQCSYNNPYLYECPKGLQFNVKSLTCDWPENVDCKLENYPRRKCRIYNKNVHCPANRTYIQHDHCDMYYDCTNGKACGKRCPDGLYFDDVTSMCNHPSSVHCKTRNDASYSLEHFSEVCQQKRRGTMKDIANTSCYYTCHHTKVMRNCCSKNRVFNEQRNRCEWRENSYGT